jgi:hypothetical protein
MSPAKCLLYHDAPCRAGFDTRMMKWSGGNIHEFHKAVKRLYNLTEVSAFVGPDCDMGLHIVDLYTVDGPQSKDNNGRHLMSTVHLHPGCVLEVRS